MQAYIDLLGLLFLAGMILGAVIPEKTEDTSHGIRILETGEF